MFIDYLHKTTTISYALISIPKGSWMYYPKNHPDTDRYKTVRYLIFSVLCVHVPVLHSYHICLISKNFYFISFCTYKTVLLFSKFQ